MHYRCDSGLIVFKYMPYLIYISALMVCLNSYFYFVKYVVSAQRVVMVWENDE